MNFTETERNTAINSLLVAAEKFEEKREDHFRRSDQAAGTSRWIIGRVRSPGGPIPQAGERVPRFGTTGGGGRRMKTDPKIKRRIKPIPLSKTADGIAFGVPPEEREEEEPDTSRPHVPGCPRHLLESAECLCNKARTALVEPL